MDSGIGAGMDSYFEYLVKGSVLFADTRWLDMFKGTKPYRKRIDIERMVIERDQWHKMG